SRGTHGQAEARSPYGCARNSNQAQSWKILLFKRPWPPTRLLQGNRRSDVRQNAEYAPPHHVARPHVNASMTSCSLLVDLGEGLFQRGRGRMHLETRVLISGGAGFLGSHLCERLLADGAAVLCVDNFFTGTRRNIEHLLSHPHFELIRHDVTFPLYVEI